MSETRADSAPEFVRANSGVSNAWLVCCGFFFGRVLPRTCAASLARVVKLFISFFPGLCARKAPVSCKCLRI